jgi:sugar O-acyltransferase (sialic acid O-acetyltransferase NeuD family)
MKKELIVIGAGGHAASCIDVIEEEATYKIVGLVDNDSSLKNLKGYAFMGNDEDLKNLRKNYENAFIAIGQMKSHKKRLNLYKNLKELKYNLPNIISPNSYTSKRSKIGKGTIVMHGCIINSGVNIGENCIINSMSLLEHDVSIGNNCHISTNVKINGNCIIGSNTFIGSGSVIKENTKIKADSYLKMFSRIVDDI